jgi:uncharacterized MAPEG superfamily protein
MMMTFAFWCLPIAMFLPLIWVGYAKVTGGDGYSNSKPRVWLEQRQGKAQRANWAQQNSYEAFPPFAAAVIVAHLTGGPQLTVDLLAGLFIVVRIAHGVFYIRDMSTLRSVAWLTGYGLTVVLFMTGQ